MSKLQIKLRYADLRDAPINTPNLTNTLDELLGLMNSLLLPFDILFTEANTQEVRFLRRIILDENSGDAGVVGIRLCEKQLSPFLFLCETHSPFAKSCQENNSAALWGAASGKAVAAVYDDFNKYLIWHETLHLLAAVDCYDDRKRRTCEMENCIMQYVACEHTVENWPFICDANVTRIRNYFEK